MKSAAHPFPVQGYKPTREEGLLGQYRGVATREELALCLYERVLEVRGEKGRFLVVTDKAERPRARHVMVAVGSTTCPIASTPRARSLRRLPTTTASPIAFVRTEGGR